MTDPTVASTERVVRYRFVASVPLVAAAGIRLSHDIASLDQERLAPAAGLFASRTGRLDAPVGLRTFPALL